MEFSKQTFIKKVIRFLFKQGNNYRNVMKEALLSGIFFSKKRKSVFLWTMLEFTSNVGNSNALCNDDGIWMQQLRHLWF